MKLFKTKSKEIVCECMSFFNFCDFSTCVVRHKRKFLLKFVANFWRNELCCVFVDVAKAELNSLRYCSSMLYLALVECFPHFNVANVSTSIRCE